VILEARRLCTVAQPPYTQCTQCTVYRRRLYDSLRGGRRPPAAAAAVVVVGLLNNSFSRLWRSHNRLTVGTTVSRSDVLSEPRVTRAPRLRGGTENYEGTESHEEPRLRAQREYERSESTRALRVTSRARGRERTILRRRRPPSSLREEEGVAGRWRGWKSARRTEHLAVARTQAKLVSRSRRGLRPLSRTSKPSRVSAIQTKVWLDSVAPAARLWRDPHLGDEMSRERRTSSPSVRGPRTGEPRTGTEIPSH